MYINIGPSNILTSSKIILYPVVPSELLLYNIVDSTITATFTNDILNHEADDKGLYFRLAAALDRDTLTYMNKFSITDILISCAKKQEESPDVSNLLMVYDMFRDNMPIDAHLCGLVCQRNDIFHRPPFNVCHRDKIFNAYIDNWDLISFGRSKFPRPILCRNFDGDEALYKLLDPYLQWSPAKFWYQEDFMTTIPEDIEGWLSVIVDSFNWDYFYSLVNNGKYEIADMKDLAASIFDIIYEDYLYYGVCKKLWLDPVQEVDPHQPLLNEKNKQVLINFTDIVNSIYQVLSDRLLKDELLPVVENEKEDTKDYTSIEKSFNLLFESMEIEK